MKTMEFQYIPVGEIFYDPTSRMDWEKIDGLTAKATMDPLCIDAFDPEEMLEAYFIEDDEDMDAGDMDGDAASALASAGWGTDEDYEHNLFDEYDHLERDHDEPYEPDYD